MSVAAGPGTRWLSEQEQASWRAYLRGSRMLNDALDDALLAHGIRLSEYEILSMLSEAPGTRLRMSVLAELVVQSRSRLTHTATRLERLGWVERRTCTQDRRGVELTLTAEGNAALEELSRVHLESVRASFVELMTAEEFARIGAAMGKVVATLGGPGQRVPPSPEPPGPAETLVR